MDIAAARAALPGITRSVFGEVVRLFPMVAGEMGHRPDTSRPPLTDVPCRFDLSPDFEQLGGGDRRASRAFASSEKATFSFEPGVLAWPVQESDIIERANGRRYRVDRADEDVLNILLFHVSRVKT